MVPGVTQFNDMLLLENLQQYAGKTSLKMVSYWLIVTAQTLVNLVDSLMYF